MTKENKDYGKSVKAKLLNLSKAEGLPYQPLLIRYVQERLLYRLAQSKYKHRFYLKGGALLYAHEQFKARPTLDIDFLGNSIANDKKIIEEAFSEICGISCEKDGIRFDTTTIETEEINENRVYKGIRLHVTARLDTAAASDVYKRQRHHSRSAGTGISLIIGRPASRHHNGLFA